MLEGKVIGRCVPRHRHQEFIRFIATVERSVPAGKVIHAILDNYAAHKHPNVLAWLADHPRWTFHFTPTSCSWLNAVEGFFSKLTRQSLKRGVFRSVDDLETAITRYIAATNREPKALRLDRHRQGDQDQTRPEPSVRVSALALLWQVQEPT